MNDYPVIARLPQKEIKPLPVDPLRFTSIYEQQAKIEPEKPKDPPVTVAPVQPGVEAAPPGQPEIAGPTLATVDPQKGAVTEPVLPSILSPLWDKDDPKDPSFYNRPSPWITYFEEWRSAFNGDPTLVLTTKRKKDYKKAYITAPDAYRNMMSTDVMSATKMQDANPSLIERFTGKGVGLRSGVSYSASLSTKLYTELRWDQYIGIGDRAALNGPNRTSQGVLTPSAQPLPEGSPPHLLGQEMQDASNNPLDGGKGQRLVQALAVYQLPWGWQLGFQHREEVTVDGFKKDYSPVDNVYLRADRGNAQMQHYTGAYLGIPIRNGAGSQVALLRTAYQDYDLTARDSQPSGGLNDTREEYRFLHGNAFFAELQLHSTTFGRFMASGPRKRFAPGFFSINYRQTNINTKSPFPDQPRNFGIRNPATGEAVLTYQPPTGAAVTDVTPEAPFQKRQELLFLFAPNVRTTQNMDAGSRTFVQFTKDDLKDKDRFGNENGSTYRIFGNSDTRIHLSKDRTKTILPILYPNISINAAFPDNPTVGAALNVQQQRITQLNYQRVVFSPNLGLGLSFPTGPNSAIELKTDFKYQSIYQPTKPFNADGTVNEAAMTDPLKHTADKSRSTSFDIGLFWAINPRVASEARRFPDYTAFKLQVTDLFANNRAIDDVVESNGQKITVANGGRLSGVRPTITFGFVTSLEPLTKRPARPKKIK